MILPVEQRQIRPCWNDFDETKICMYLYYFGDYPCSKNEGRYAEYNENSFDVTYNDYKLQPCPYHITLSEVEELIDQHNKGDAQ
jgi:hypothetical protein